MEKKFSKKQAHANILVLVQKDTDTKAKMKKIHTNVLCPISRAEKKSTI